MSNLIAVYRVKLSPNHSRIHRLTVKPVTNKTVAEHCDSLMQKLYGKTPFELLQVNEA